MYFQPTHHHHDLLYASDKPTKPTSSSFLSHSTQKSRQITSKAPPPPPNPPNPQDTSSSISITIEFSGIQTSASTEPLCERNSRSRSPVQGHLRPCGRITTYFTRLHSHIPNTNDETARNVAHIQRRYSHNPSSRYAILFCSSDSENSLKKIARWGELSKRRKVYECCSYYRMVLITATTSQNSNLLKPPPRKKVNERNATDREFSELNNSATSGDTRSHHNDKGPCQPKKNTLLSDLSELCRKGSKDEPTRLCMGY